jgi:tetratricopeptide (TPR) repeat protein
MDASKENIDMTTHIHRFFLACTAACLLAALIIPASVSADVAPPEPPFGSNPYHDGTGTQVQMAAEKVVFDVAATSAYRNGQAHVSAAFQMHNQGSQDEKMMVRFPLGVVYDEKCIYSPYPSINDLSAKVDGAAAAVTTSYELVNNYTVDPQVGVKIPCWANFPVTFPGDQDVTIAVSYTAQGYGDLPQTDESLGLGGNNPSAEIAYWYVLETGAGWYGSIGKADVIFHFPYEANDKNVDMESTGTDWTLSGNEISWHRENFEPDNILRVYVVNPSVWQSILTETKNTQANPQDGEAWGRLAKAYKQAIWERRGFRMDPAGLEMYALGRQAYDQALSLLPKDAEWHYGYAELLCWHAMWGYFDANSQKNNPDWPRCMQQLKTALDLNPGYAQSKEALQELAQFNPGVVDLSGPQPDYLILTPHPTQTIEVMSTPVTTATGAAPTATIMIAPTQPVATVVNPTGAVQIPTQAIAPGQDAGESSPYPWTRTVEWGGLGLILILGTFVVIKRLGKGK